MEENKDLVVDFSNTTLEGKRKCLDDLISEIKQVITNYMDLALKVEGFTIPYNPNDNGAVQQMNHMKNSTVIAVNAKIDIFTRAFELFNAINEDKLEYSLLDIVGTVIKTFKNGHEYLLSPVTCFLNDNRDVERHFFRKFNDERFIFGDFFVDGSIKKKLEELAKEKKESEEKKLAEELAAISVNFPELVS